MKLQLPAREPGLQSWHVAHRSGAACDRLRATGRATVQNVASRRYHSSQISPPASLPTSPFITSFINMMYRGKRKGLPRSPPAPCSCRRVGPHLAPRARRPRSGTGASAVLTLLVAVVSLRATLRCQWQGRVNGRGGTEFDLLTDTPKCSSSQWRADRHFCNDRKLLRA